MSKPNQRSGVIWWLVSALALIAIAAVALWPRIDAQLGQSRRGPVKHFSAVSPVGTVPARPEKLLWTPQRNATQYRVELLDVTSRSRFSTVVFDTFLELDPSIDMPLIGYWKVTPLGPDQSEVGSPILTRYRIGP